MPKVTNKRELDYEYCWKLFIREGLSVYRIAKILRDEGVINPKNGKSYHAQSVWRGAWLWALDNIQEARNDMETYYTSVGKILDDDTFYRDILAKAKTHLTKVNYQKFLEKHSYMKPYLPNES